MNIRPEMQVRGNDVSPGLYLLMVKVRNVLIASKRGQDITEELLDLPSFAESLAQRNTQARSKVLRFPSILLRLQPFISEVIEAAMLS